MKDFFNYYSVGHSLPALLLPLPVVASVLSLFPPTLIPVQGVQIIERGLLFTDLFVGVWVAIDDGGKEEIC